MKNWIHSEIVIGAIGVALSLLATIGATQVVVAIDPLTAILVVLLLIKETRHAKEIWGKNGADEKK